MYMGCEFKGGAGAPHLGGRYSRAGFRRRYRISSLPQSTVGDVDYHEARDGFNNHDNDRNGNPNAERVQNGYQYRNVEGNAVQDVDCNQHTDLRGYGDNDLDIHAAAQTGKDNQQHHHTISTGRTVPGLVTRRRGEGGGEELRKHMHRLCQGYRDFLRQPGQSNRERIQLYTSEPLGAGAGGPIQYLMERFAGTTPQQDLATGRLQGLLGFVRGGHGLPGVLSVARLFKCHSSNRICRS